MVLSCTVTLHTKHREKGETVILFPHAVEDFSTVQPRSCYETKYFFLAEKETWEKHVRQVLEQLMNSRFTCHACFTMQPYAEVTKVQAT